MLNISRIKDKLTINFSQLIENFKRITFLSKPFRKRGRKTSTRPLFVFQKNFTLGKSKWSPDRFYFISIAVKLACIRNKLFITLHYSSRDMLNLDFLDKVLRIVSPAHFVYDFSTKLLLVIYSTNWPKRIAFFSLLPEILGCMCIAIAC